MIIRLKNIQLYAYHGVALHERELGGKFEIDVELTADLEKAARSDDLADTIDYVKVHQSVVYVASTKKYHLLESLCESIAQHLLATFPIDETLVRIRKPGAALGGVVDTVEVECRKLK